MKQTLTVLKAAIASLAIALIAAGLSTSSASGSPAAAGPRVDLAKSRLGRMLVDARGRTLYLFEHRDVRQRRDLAEVLGAHG
jgi:predicted lipoprotein with Yx(FWY)xxD motif